MKRSMPFNKRKPIANIEEADDYPHIELKKKIIDANTYDMLAISSNQAAQKSQVFYRMIISSINGIPEEENAFQKAIISKITSKIRAKYKPYLHQKMLN